MTNLGWVRGEGGANLLKPLPSKLVNTHSTVLGRRHEGTEALDTSRHLFHLAVSELYELYQTDNIKYIAFL